MNIGNLIADRTRHRERMTLPLGSQTLKRAGGRKAKVRSCS